MRKLFFLALVMLFPVICQAGFDAGKWQYYKSIEKGANSGLIRLSLDDEIFSGANKDLSDLRIVDNNGVETPYKMMVGKDSVKAETYQPKILNNSFAAGQYTTAILDFGQRGTAVNQLTIRTNSENFQRNVTVYGSDDRSDWKVIKNDAYIYDYTDKRGNIKSNNLTVSFPESIYRYLKIEIADSENDPVKINSVEAVNFIKEYSRELERKPVFTVNQDTKERVTEMILDLGARGIPTNKIAISASDKNFNRSLMIFAGNNNADWKLIANSYIFRYQTDRFTGSNLLIDVPEVNDRYIKVVIINKDDQPLSGLSANTFSTYREVIFQAENQDYRVYFGNAKADQPEYDLEKYFQYLDIANARYGTLSKQQANNAYVPEKIPEKPLTERMPYLMPAALVFACLILLLLVYQFFRKK